MANTFVGPFQNAGHNVTNAKLPAFNATQVAAPVIPPPGTGSVGGLQPYVPIRPLPGIVGAGSYAI